jgi:hypothetical protein
LKSEVNTAQTAHVITPSSSSSSSSPLPLPALPQRPLCSHALIECTSDACLQGGWGWRLAPCCLRSQTLPCIARLEQAFASLRSGWVWPHLHLLVARTTCRAEVPGVAYKRLQGGRSPHQLRSLTRHTEHTRTRARRGWLWAYEPTVLHYACSQ